MRSTILPIVLALLLATLLIPTIAEKEVPLPDLMISPEDIQFSNEYPRPGETVIINVTVHNIGDMDASTVKVRFYVNKIIYPPDKTIDSIPSNSSDTTSTSWIAPLSGTYEIKVVVDPDGTIPEKNENNNEASRNITISDGGAINVEMEVSNEKCMPREIFWVNGSATYGTIPVANATVTVTIKPSGNTASTVTDNNGKFSVNMSAPDKCGIYEVEATVKQALMEGNATRSFQVVLSDLKVVGVEVLPEKPMEGDSVSIKATIRNAGTASAKNITIVFYDNNKEISHVIIEELKDGNFTMVETKWKAIKGERTIKVVADPDNKIDEMDENNNDMSTTVTVVEKKETTPGFEILMILISVIVVLWRNVVCKG